MVDFAEMSAVQLASRIFQAIRNREAASFIRFNDGEARFVGRTKYYPANMVVEIITRQFGYNVLTEEELVKLGTSVMSAVSHAEVIGLPPADWPSDFARARDIVAASLRTQTVSTAHVDFHQHFFESDFFSELFLLGVPVAAITCRDVREFVRDIYGGSFCSLHQVPEQADGSYCGNIKRHYPIYSNALCCLLEETAKGTVYLIGAGICGKIYCEAVRRGGGVAIDIGSIFDLWAGRFSRTYMETRRIKDYYLNRLENGDYNVAVLRACYEIKLWDKRYDQAAAVLELASKTYPEHSEFQLKTVRLFLLTSQFETALTATKMLEGRLDAPALLILGKLLKESILSAHAQGVLMKAFMLDPSFSPVLIELCGLLVEPNSVPPWVRQSVLRAVKSLGVLAPHPLLFQFARVLGASGDIASASTYCRMAIKAFSLDPGYAQHFIAWLNLLGQHEEALEVQSKIALSSSA